MGRSHFLIGKATIATVAALAVGLGGGASAASARTPCADEGLRASSSNLPQVTAAVQCLVDQQRARFGLAPFHRDARLDASAALHSADMAAHDFFAHVNLQGLSPDDRARAQGYGDGAGENIAYGYPTALAVMKGWMASQGHCENLLSSASDLGLGVALDPSGVVYMAQAFGHYGRSSAVAAAACPVADIDGDPVATYTPPVAPSPTTSTVPVVSTPAASAVTGAAAPTASPASATRQPSLRVRLRAGRLRWTLSGVVSGLTGRTQLRLVIGGRSVRTTAVDGRFSVKIAAPRTRRVQVAVSSPASGSVAAARQVVTLRLAR